MWLFHGLLLFALGLALTRLWAGLGRGALAFLAWTEVPDAVVRPHGSTPPPAARRLGSVVMWWLGLSIGCGGGGAVVVLVW